jgi:hypothetical protein
MSRIHCNSPAGYQRRHGAKGYAETGEVLGARRRNTDEETLPINVSGKWWGSTRMADRAVVLVICTQQHVQ